MSGMSESNVELVRRGYQAALEGDLDQIGELLDPEVSWHGGDPSAPGACRNRDQALEFMRRARERSRGPLGELVEVIDAGERVVVVMRRRSRDPGEDTELVANLTTFRDHKVIEMVHYARVEDALAAAGL